MKQLTLINPHDVTEEEANTYEVREAARAVLVDQEGNVALLHVTKANHYKTPGGGIEEGEDAATALHRECLEEAGCEIEDVEDLGMVTEYRKPHRLKQITYGFTARVKGEKGAPQFMPDEVEDGFELVWLPWDEAVKVVAESQSVNEESRSYIVPRESLLLQSAKDYVSKHQTTL